MFEFASATRDNTVDERVRRFFQSESGPAASCLWRWPALAAAYQASCTCAASCASAAMRCCCRLVVWVNDLWMAVFFFPRRPARSSAKLLEGERFASLRQAALLLAGAALGGMVVPALIYVAPKRAAAVGCAAGPSPPPPTSPSRWRILMLLGCACRHR